MGESLPRILKPPPLIFNIPNLLWSYTTMGILFNRGGVGVEIRGGESHCFNLQVLLERSAWCARSRADSFRPIDYEHAIFRLKPQKAKLAMNWASGFRVEA